MEIKIYHPPGQQSYDNVGDYHFTSATGMTDTFTRYANSKFLMQLLLTIPALFIAISAGFAGILIDRYGRLKFLWIAMILYTISGSTGFWAEDLILIIFSRAILGIAVGVTMTIVTTLIADYFDGLQRQKFVGIQIAFMSLGGIIFLSAGGILADFGWRYPFLLYAFALLILPLAITYLKEPDRSIKSSNPETQVKSPPYIWLLFINTMIMWVLFFLIPVQVPFYLKEINIESNTLIGLSIAISTAFSAIASFSFSTLKKKLSFHSIFALGYALMAIGYFTLASATSFGVVSLSMISCGLGIGMMIPNTNMWIMQIAPAQIRGREIGKLTTFWFMGQFLSPIIMLPLTSNYSLNFYFPDSGFFPTGNCPGLCYTNYKIPVKILKM